MHGSGDFVYQLADIGSLMIVLSLLVAVHKKYNLTYDKTNDTMPVFNFIPACVLLAICCHGDLNDSPFFDVMWTIGLHLDTVAMLPQLSRTEKQVCARDAVVAVVGRVSCSNVCARVCRMS